MDQNATLARLRKLVEKLEHAAELSTCFSESGPEVAARAVDHQTTAVTIAGVDVYVRNTPGAVIVSVGIEGLPSGKSAWVESFDGVSWERQLP